MRKLALIAVIAAGAAMSQAIVINEFVLNHTGTDTNEFIEIFTTPNADLSGITLLTIEGDGTPAGVIDSVDALGTANANGYFTVSKNNIFENGTITLMLVRGFSGAVTNDTDTNNDGVIDNALWSEIIDSVGIFDGGATDFNYTPTVLTPSFDGGSNTVGGASRLPNGTGSWVRNDFDGAGLPGFTGTPVLGEAYNTPNAVNEAVPEPATMLAMLAGLGALAARRRK